MVLKWLEFITFSEDGNDMSNQIYININEHKAQNALMISHKMGDIASPNNSTYSPPPL